MRLDISTPEDEDKLVIIGSYHFETQTLVAS